MSTTKTQKIELTVQTAHLIKNWDATVDAMPLGVLRVMHQIMMPEAAEIKGKGSERRLRAALKKRMLQKNMPAPVKPEARKLNFAPVLTGFVVMYSLQKTVDGMCKLIEKRTNDWLNDNAQKLKHFCFGKASGPTALAALKSRWTNRYSKKAYNYTNMVLMYEDTGTDKTKLEQRQKRALKVEENLHALFNGHEKWDTRINDSPGPKTRKKSARFYVYLAYKCTE